MKFSYKFKFTPEHFLELQKCVWVNMLDLREVRNWNRAFSGFLYAGLAAFLIFAIDLATSDPTLRMAFFLIISVVSLVSWYFSAHFFQSYVMRKWASEFGAKNGEVTLTISESGISQASALHSFTYSWQAVGSIKEACSLVILFTDAANGIMCPRSAIPDDEYDALLTFCREHIAER